VAGLWSVGALRARWRCDVRVLLHRHCHDVRARRQHDEQRDDDREDRPLDEEFRHGQFTARTVMPGCTFCRPATITRSPSFKPPSTTQFAPEVRLAWIVRSATLLSGPTTSAVACPCRLGVTPTCGTSSALSFTPSSMLACTNIPGSST